MLPPRINIIGIGGIREVTPGDQLAEIFIKATIAQNDPIVKGDVLVVAQKVISKAEGRFVDLTEVISSTAAESFASASGKDPRLIEMVLRESRSIVKQDAARGILITETEHGHICANAGIDSSNVPGKNMVLLLPKHPDQSARRLVEDIQSLAQVEHVGVIIADTFGRPWREGHTNVAIGVAGLNPLKDYRGIQDTSGQILRVTEMAVADEIAGAAELVMGKTLSVPLAIVRGISPEAIDLGATTGSGALIRCSKTDLFR